MTIIKYFVKFGHSDRAGIIIACEHSLKSFVHFYNTKIINRRIYFRKGTTKKLNNKTQRPNLILPQQMRNLIPKQKYHYWGRGKNIRIVFTTIKSFQILYRLKGLDAIHSQ